MPTSPTSERAPGFTLLEVLVTLTVVALAAGLLLPRLGDLTALETDRAARRLAAALTLARERAVLGGRPLTVTLDLDAGRWRVEGATTDTEAAALPARVRLREVTVDGTTVRQGAVRLRLEPTGDVVAVRIELADDRGRALSIVLPPAGVRAAVVQEAPA